MKCEVADEYAEVGYVDEVAGESVEGELTIEYPAMA